MPSRTVARSPHIVDGSRSVHPKGHFPTAALLIVGLLPILPLLLAVVDSRSGFRLLMLSLAVYAAALLLALWFWARSLRERLVRVAAAGPLRFTPDARARAALWLVPTVGLLPSVANIVVHAAGLPTMNSRLLDWGPYVLGLVSLVELARQIAAVRTPLGLVVDERGLHGVRGSASVEIPWEDIDGVEPLGPHGPKLSIASAGRAPVIIDAHHLGSDPAAVAVAISYFRDNFDQRHLLADGVTAMRTLADALHP